MKRLVLNLVKRKMMKIGIVFLIILVINLFQVFDLAPVRAAKVSDIQDVVTRLEVSTVADHEIKFKTLTGVEASTDTITYTFENGFDMANIVLGDIDFFHGSTTGLEIEENVGNTAGSDRWGFAILGQVLTMTAPTDTVAGEIAADDYVILRIGTNASGGMNQIINPGSVAIYSVSINGNFGDVGAVYIPVIAGDEVTVTAVVAADEEEEEEDEGEGGGGGGVIEEDVTAPVIENIRVENITSNSARIVWDTDEASIGRLEFGLDTTYGEVRTDLNNLYFFHGFDLFPLTQDTEYYFKIIVKDQSGNKAISEDYSFKTIMVGNVINFKADGQDSQILLDWQNPDMDNMAGVRIVRSEENYLEFPEEGLIIYEGSGDSFMDRDVINGKWYFYTTFVYDTTRQYGSGAIAEAVSLADGVVIIPPKPEPIEDYLEIIGGLRFGDLEFRVANGSLRIYPDRENNITVLSETLLSVLLHQDNVIKKLKTIIVQIGDSSYLLKINKSKGKYQTAVSTPKEIGDYPIVVLVIVYEDGTKDTVRGDLTVERYGEINGMPAAKSGEAKAGWYSEKVAGVSIALFEKKDDEEWEKWNGIKYFQYNPQLTGENGEYGYMVPNGKYYLAMEKEGYKKSVTEEFEVTDNVINFDLKLDRVMKRRWYLQWGWWLAIGLLLLFIIWWRRRKKKKEEEDKKEKLKKQVLT